MAVRRIPALQFQHLVLLPVILVAFSLFLSAQSTDSQTSDPDKSWTNTTETGGDGASPTRTSSSHTHSGNRTQDNQSIQRRNDDGRYVPFQDVEKETVQVDSSTVRTTTRIFGRDADGKKTLVQVSEEERRTQPGGTSKVVRSTSNSDVNGHLQLVQREVEETKSISKNVSETKITVMASTPDGSLAPAREVQTRHTQDANGTVESRTTTLLPDGSGHWQIGEVRQETIRQDGGNRSSEDRIFRPDAEGKLSEVSRTVSKDSGDNRSTVETYSADLPGTAPDGTLRLVQRATTTMRKNSNGQQTTQQQVEQVDPGAPDSGLRVTMQITDTAKQGASGTQSTRTVQVGDPSNSLGVVSIDIAKPGTPSTVQVQIAPSEKPK